MLPFNPDPSASSPLLLNSNNEVRLEHLKIPLKTTGNKIQPVFPGHRLQRDLLFGDPELRRSFSPETRFEFLSVIISQSVVSNSLRPHGVQPTRLLCPWDSPGQEYWSELPFPSPEDLPDPGIEPGSPALQADSLPTEPPETHLFP